MDAVITTFLTDAIGVGLIPSCLHLLLDVVLHVERTTTHGCSNTKPLLQYSAMAAMEAALLAEDTGGVPLRLESWESLAADLQAHGLVHPALEALKQYFHSCRMNIEESEACERFAAALEKYYTLRGPSDSSPPSASAC